MQCTSADRMVHSTALVNSGSPEKPLTNDVSEWPHYIKTSDGQMCLRAHFSSWSRFPLAF
jgi:hypothetical protein